MNKKELAAKIWESANNMRSKIEANEYKDYILGFIFYKFLSDKEENWLIDRGYEPEDIRNYVNEDDRETLQAARQNLGYFIAYKDLFSTWIELGADFSIDNVRVALSSFSRLISPTHKRVFEGIFHTLETGLSKLGENTKAQSKAVRDLIHLIDDIPMDNKQDYDVLGFIYEDLISKFASNAGKKAGEFYTPHEVSLLMSEIIADHLKGRPSIKIYDSTSGSGSLLINIGKTTAKYMDNANRIRYYAQELKNNTYNLTRMNLVMRGISPDNIWVRNGDTLEEDWPYFEESDPHATYDPLYLDAVVSNPPYSQRWNPDDKENDPRYAAYGLAPKSKADYAFLLHDLFHLQSDGIMTIVLPHGVLFRGGEEGQIRKNLLEENNIDTIIGLPSNIFFGTGIPTIIMVLKKARSDTDVLIIDASKGFAKEGKNNKLRASDIRKIVDTIKQRKDVERYARRVSRDEIRANAYNMNIPRYVDSSDPPESCDIYASMFGGVPSHELDAFNDYWTLFPSLKTELFEGDGDYLDASVENFKEAILANRDVQDYLKHFHQAFDDLSVQLDQELIDQANHLSIPKTYEKIADDLFQRFTDVALVDPYKAYEIFAKAYEEISGDLELIQSEGLGCIKQVDPNMVAKTRNGKTIEVQNGWKGHILPFELVQKIYLAKPLNALEAKQVRLNAIPDDYQDILESLSEDDKEVLGDFLNENNDGFVFGNLKAVRKELLQDKEENRTILSLVDKVEALNKEEKNLKKTIKAEEDALHLACKARIESLSDEEVRLLLHEKWTKTIVCQILDLADRMLDTFAQALKELSSKYDLTLEAIECDIRETEQMLCQMLDTLTGSESDMKGIKELQRLLGGVENV